MSAVVATLCLVPRRQSDLINGSKGNWIATTPIPNQTLESREIRLEGKDKELLLALARKILRWLPEERPTAQELFDDEFIIQFARGS